ncbi:aminotransferase class I and II family protein, partial [Chlamydia psittaci 06-1683]
TPHHYAILQHSLPTP